MLITLARKPLTGSVVQNVLTHGCGALNVDACRIGVESWDAQAMQRVNSPGSGRNYEQTARKVNGRWDGPIGTGAMDTTKGRWPANVLHDGSDAVLAGFPQTTSGTPSGTKKYSGFDGGWGNNIAVTGFGDSGSAARFFKRVQRQPDGFPSQDKLVGVNGGTV